MFRKIVSGLPFSPALVGQLGFYAKRLRQEEATRRIGLLFTALAVIMQSFAVFTPPESANAANESDFIRGGISSLNDVLAAYDQSARGKGDIKNILDYAGITREELAAAKSGSINSKQFGTGPGAALSWGRVSRFSSDQGEVKHVVPTKDSSSTVYSRPLWRYDTQASTVKKGSTYEAYIGHSAKIGWFAILKDCANLVTIKTPQPIPTGKVAASCTAISGFAYDTRQLNQKVKVYLYFGGPAGKGERVGPLNASDSNVSSPVGNGYGYSYKVPEKYKSSTTPTKVYAVMIPLAGWSESSVQLGTADIPSNCKTPKPTANASCDSLSHKKISRTSVSLKASSSVSNGADIKGYSFIIKDVKGKVVHQQSVVSSESTIATAEFDVKNIGTYTAAVTAHTSLGDKSGDGCTTSFTVSTEKQCLYNPKISPKDASCEPCPGDESKWIKDEDCTSHIILGKKVTNLTQGIEDANYTTVMSGDRIEYTIYAENTGLAPATVSLSEQLFDVVEYATISDLGGASYNSESKVLSWGEIALKPNEKQARKFVVQIQKTIPTTPQGISEPGSYDCVITNTYGNSTSLRVDCPTAKLVEQTIKELPKTGATTNILFSFSLVVATTYFYARSRQLSREIKLIRRDFNSGNLI